ncbi:hypothetical protein C4Y55_026490, partial [Klebsiella pneumoniae subsp. pneumoniae]
GTVCVVGKMRDLILQLSKSSIYSTKPRLPAACRQPQLHSQCINDRSQRGRHIAVRVIEK